MQEKFWEEKLRITHRKTHLGGLAIAVAMRIFVEFEVYICECRRGGAQRKRERESLEKEREER